VTAMDLIWLSHFIPYPPRGGAYQRSFNLLREAARRYRVSLFAFNRPTQNPSQLAESRRAFESFCHRVEFWELPFPWRGARWWSKMALAPLYRWPQSCLAYDSRQTARRWREVLDEYREALVHIDSADLALFIKPALRFPTFLNHHNCESAMALRRASLETNWLKRLALRQQADKLAWVEASLCQRVHMNLAVSEEDAERLAEISPEARIAVVENGTDTEFFAPNDSLLEGNTIVFASSLRWYPNQSALMFFDREIWPLLKARVPGVRFIVAGQQPPEWVVRWATADAAVEFAPNAPDIRPFIARGAVYVCPIIDGGGSRLKLLDAMAMGKAIVSTTTGAEGLRYTAGKEMMIADSPADFAAAVEMLLRTPQRRRALSVSARKLAVERYGWESIGRSLERAYASAVRSPLDGSYTVAGQSCPLGAS